MTEDVRLSVDAELKQKLVSWRHHLHTHPELSGQEKTTSAFVAERLTEMGIPFRSSIGGHGIVATLTRGISPASVGLRADMDALPILEETNLPYASQNRGVMHACGHDGHTTCLLGAAALLAKDDSWNGTARFIFQPAEETGVGAKALLADGLLADFPVDRFFAFHNWPALESGTVAVRAGAMMAFTGRIYLTVHGRAAHAATPHRSRDSLLAAAQLIVATQAIVAREIDPSGSAVVSLCTMNAGTALNQIPAYVTMTGTMRANSLDMRNQIEQSLARICEGIAKAYAVEITCKIDRGTNACTNTQDGAEIAQQAAVAAGLLVDPEPQPSMVGEDFAWLLAERPGALAWIGNGPANDGRELHSPHYDFNDEILPAGSLWLANVAKMSLRR